VPFLLFANKQDLLHALTPQEITQGLNLYAMRDRVWQIFPCSAKMVTGIKDGMDFIIQEIRDNRAARSLGMM
jgi:ADP-ribosylation factor-like protein 3